MPNRPSHMGAAVLAATSTRARDASAQLARVRLAVVTDRCWSCRGRVRAIAGVLLDAASTARSPVFAPLASVDAQLTGALEPRALAARGIGMLRHRESPGVPGGYIANSCVHCDALIGRFAIEDLVTEHLARGGSAGALDSGISVELPLRTAPDDATRDAVAATPA